MVSEVKPFVSSLSLMSYVTGVLLRSLFSNNLAFLWICVCSMIWIVLFSWIDNLLAILQGHRYCKRFELLDKPILKKSKMSTPEPSPGPSNPKKRKRIPDEISFCSSPMKKRLKRTGGMGSIDKNVAINIYKHLGKCAPTYPVKTEIVKSTAEIMGVSVSTIKRILNEYKTTGKVLSPDRSKPKYEIVEKLDEFTLSAIRRKVHQFYFNNDVPTVDKVLTAVNDDEDLPSFSRSTMYNILKKLNFKYAKRSRKSILLDRQDLMVWRSNYLLRIKDYRKENRKIYYTDETWVNEGHTSSYVWVDENIKKGKRLIVTHIGSTDGFLEGAEWLFEAKKTDREGDYHGEMDAHNFEKWFKKVLDLVEPGSVIVLDNAPYHSRLAERVPNMNWRKAEIQAWLQGKQIAYEEKENKAVLLTKFQKENSKNKVVDEMAAAKGVITLRLPPYHCELNPIELIWAQLKSYVGRNNKTFKMAEIKQLTKEGINKIGAASWKKCIEHIIKEEDKMLELDGLMDTTTDNLQTSKVIIHVSENESDLSTDDDDDVSTDD